MAGRLFPVVANRTGIEKAVIGTHIENESLRERKKSRFDGEVDVADAAGDL